MKPRYTVTVTDNETGEQMLDFDMTSINYKVESTNQLLNHFSLGGGVLTEEIGPPIMTLTISGRCIASDFEEEKAPTKPGPCRHDWVDYHGFIEEYKVCGLCGEKRSGQEMRHLEGGSCRE